MLHFNRQTYSHANFHILKQFVATAESVSPLHLSEIESGCSQMNSNLVSLGWGIGLGNCMIAFCRSFPASCYPELISPLSSSSERSEKATSQALKKGTFAPVLPCFEAFLGTFLPFLGAFCATFKSIFRTKQRG